MHGKHYIRNLMIDRISGERHPQESGRTVAAPDGLTGGNDRRRFRRMAENRKRQILERMLLDDDREAAGLSTDVERESGRHA